jgi:hypothetical protein
MAFSLVAAAERLAGALKPPLTIIPPPAGGPFDVHLLVPLPSAAGPASA